jgi:hypothetical protein
VWLAFVALNLADFAINAAQSRFVLVVSAILVAGTGLAYALALRPRVIADPTGITVVNPFRTHHVPWGLVISIDAGEWVRVHHSPDKTINCWALYVSARARARRSVVRPGIQRRLSMPSMFGGEPKFADPSRLPDEAKHLASLPAALAIATSLGTRATKERKASTRQSGTTAVWSWPAIAAVALSAVALVVVALI